MTCGVCGIWCEGYDGANRNVCDDWDAGRCWIEINIRTRLAEMGNR